MFLWGSKMERGHRWILRIPLCDGASRELYQPGNAVARRSGTTRKACYMLNFNIKGLLYGKVLIRPELPLPRTGKPIADVPLTIDVVPWPVKPVKTGSPFVKQTLYAFMITGFMEEVSRVQLEYARCAGKGRSCIKTWRNLVQRVVLEDWRTS